MFGRYRKRNGGLDEKKKAILNVKRCRYQIGYYNRVIIIIKSYIRRGGNAHDIKITFPFTRIEFELLYYLNVRFSIAYTCAEHVATCRRYKRLHSIQRCVDVCIKIVRIRNSYDRLVTYRHAFNAQPLRSCPRFTSYFTHRSPIL